MRHHSQTSVAVKTSAYNKKYIITDGTSSSGKTTLCKYYQSHRYTCLSFDDYWEKSEKEMDEILKHIQNDYINEHNPHRCLLTNDCLTRKLMVDDAIKSNNVMFDDISQKELLKELSKRKLLNKTFVILLYTNLKNLVRNMETRRKDGNARGVFVFEQFADKYVNAHNDTPIDVVNRKDFKNLLKDNMKYAFTDEENLVRFADHIFKKMDIADDDDHPIKVRDGIRVDYLLNTTGKRKEDVYAELDKLMEHLDHKKII